MLGYTTSAKAPTANIDITINNGSGHFSFCLGTVFTSSIGGTSYQFVTNVKQQYHLLEGVYKFSSVYI